MKSLIIISSIYILIGLQLHSQEKEDFLVNISSIENIDSLILKIESILDTGYDDIDIFTNGVIYGKLEGNEDFNKLLNHSQSNYFKNTKDIDTSITSIIREAIIHDQGIRKYYKLNIEDTMIVNYCIRKMKEIDSIYTLQIINILDKYNYPGFSVVGPLHQDDAFNIIQHTDAATQKKYLQKIKDACDSFEMSPSLLEMLIDRILVSETGKQFFGTQYYLENNQNMQYSIDNKSIDEIFEYLNLH